MVFWLHVACCGYTFSGKIGSIPVVFDGCLGSIAFQLIKPSISFFACMSQTAHQYQAAKSDNVSLDSKFCDLVHLPIVVRVRPLMEENWRLPKDKEESKKTKQSVTIISIVLYSLPMPLGYQIF